MTSTTISSTSTTQTEEEETIATKSNKDLYYGYNLETEADEVVHPVFESRVKSFTLKQAKEEGLTLFHKRNVFLVNKIKSMVTGIENWPIEKVYGVVEPDTLDDNTMINFILEDLEKQKKIVKVHDFEIVQPAWNSSDSEKPRKVYSAVNFKWYTIEKAQADNVLEIKCKHGNCSKKFKTDYEMNKHFNHFHVGRQVS